MSNPFYTPSGTPAFRAGLSSSQIRAEFLLVQAAFDKLVPFTPGDAGNIAVQNLQAQSLTVPSGMSATESSTQVPNTAWVMGRVNSIPIVTVTGTTYTISASDAGKMIRCTNAAGCTVTIPGGAGIPNEIVLMIRNASTGTGGVILSPGSGVTVNNPGLNSMMPKATVMIHKVGTNEWDLTGDVV